MRDLHNPFSRLDDAELETAIAVAHDKAVNAGAGASDAWARFSREWCQLCDERDRRARAGNPPSSLIFAKARKAQQ